MALGKADFTRSEASSTPRVTQAYQREPELRHVTPAFRSLPHPRAGAGPKGFPVPLSAFLPPPPRRLLTPGRARPAILTPRSLQTDCTASRPAAFETLPSDSRRRGSAPARTLTVATILLTAAAESSSPLGCSTSVMPMYLRLKSIPSSSVSRVSVQFSGSSRETTKRLLDSQTHKDTPVKP